MKLTQFATPRLAFSAVVVLVVVAIASALYLQYVEHLEPCPLCALQRVAFVAAALLALPGAVFALGRTANRALAFCALVAATAGAGVAGWHSYLMAHPPDAMGCGRPFEWFHKDFPLSVWLPRIFAGKGDCLAVDWSLFGLTLPQLSLLLFVVLIALLLWAARGRGNA